MSRVVGTRVKRREDSELLRGEARFIADLALPGMAHMAILRSPHGHARIRHVDTAGAAAAPGVIRVVTSADIEGKLWPLPCVWIPGGVESHFPEHPLGVPGAMPVLAKEQVRFIGDAVAAVVAETRQQAYDALELIKVDYEPLPVVVSAVEAVGDGAPQLHEGIPQNLNAYWTCGDSAAASKALEGAEVVVELSLHNQRTINSPLEPRGALGAYDAASGEYTLYASSQSPHNHRLLLALMVLNIPFNKLHLVSPNIGGSFGTKGYLYPDMPLVLWLAKELGRPVKWVDTREGMMRSTVQGRDHVMTARLGGTKAGKITAVTCTSHANLGAYPSTIGPGVATAMMGRSLTGVYAIPNAFCEVYAVFTNTVPLGAQRGSGRAEATNLIERLVDKFAREVGKDPAEVRRLNLVPQDKMPYDNGLGWLYDSGDYPKALELALEKAGWNGREKEKAEARSRGRRRGFGIASFVAVSGVGPSQRMSQEGMQGGTWESANVRVHPTGEVTVIVGSKPHGQSHETVFAQVAAEELGVPVDKVEVLHSDTKRAPYGQGSYGSRSLSVAGPAVQQAAVRVREKMVQAFAHQAEVSVDDVVLEPGSFSVKGSPQSAKTFQEVALEVWYAWNLPPGMEPNLDITAFFDPPDFNYPYGAHVAVVDVDETTGAVEIVRYVAVSDVGEMVNPMVVEGQVQGGITHGLGQALTEEAVYTPEGRLLTTSFADYALPRADTVPGYDIEQTVTPSPHNGLGAKGAGEVGTVPVTAAVANALLDALGEAAEGLDMPFTPEKVWRVLGSGKGGA